MQPSDIGVAVYQDEKVVITLREPYYLDNYHRQDSVPTSRFGRFPRRSDGRTVGAPGTSTRGGPMCLPRAAAVPSSSQVLERC